ncbi:MAG: replication/maintenance protein [Clostridiales bacterium]|nr:MAG: replication/maintenance protein [Clostridiales bacterium]PWM27377.1 MAG: replication/maintenance protein [Clostridiales bacterium]PWM27381.1 MAG: replication/maintenance protein [Clostridiales bacterium]
MARKPGQQTTSKKVKYVGTEQFINVNTGEVEDFAVTGIEERDFNFHKVWMRNFISTLDIVGNQKTKLCFWIIDNLNKENQLIYTYRQIAEKTGMSLETVRVTMNILIESNFLRRQNQGCYIVNPDIVFKGTRPGRLNVLNQYHDVSVPEPSDEEKLSNLLAAMQQLQKQVDQLYKKINKKQQEESAPMDDVEKSA